MTEKNLIEKNIDITSLIGYVAIFVIVILLVNIGIKLTGYATSSTTSMVNITIQSNAVINFSISNINFGSGILDVGALNATVDTLGTVENGNWTPVTEGFIIENLGSVNVTLDLKTGKNADSFLGGTTPSYQYNISNNKTGSCVAEKITLGQWNDVNTTSPGTRICDVFAYENTKDVIRIDLKLLFFSDITSGNKTDIFIATATTI